MEDLSLGHSVWPVSRHALSCAFLDVLIDFTGGHVLLTNCTRPLLHCLLVHTDKAFTY